MARILTAAAGLLLLAGCANFGGLATDLGDAIARQPDPATAREAAPAYLVMADTFAAKAPGDAAAQLAAARLYTAFAGGFVESPERRRTLTSRAREYARAGLCLRLDSVCTALDTRFPEFRASLATVSDEDEAHTLYRFAAAWAGWVRARPDDYDALAELPWIDAAFRRVVEIAPAVDHGNAHVYLGVLLSQRPQALGGSPDEAQDHFERAIALDGRNLMARVLYAQHYARLVLDRELHDRLLDEVLASDAQAGELTLSNALAQQRARDLRAHADEHF